MVDFHGITRPAAVALLLALSLTGCGSYSPGALYDKVADVFASPADAGDYPNLAGVPARPTPPSLADRQQASAGLVADRNNAQYTEQVLRNPQASPPPPPSSSNPVAERPVAATPPVALPPADPVMPPGAPVVRLVDGKIVASPGFFGTEAPPNSAPPAALPPPLPSNLPPGSVPQPEQRIAASPTPDIVPEAPPPPPFDLPPRPAPAVAALPPPPVPARQAAPAPAPARPTPSAPSLQPIPEPTPAASSPARNSGSAAGSAIAVIYFGDGQSGLTDDARHVLSQVADIYRLHGGRLRVVGYSGNAGGGGDPVRNSIAALNLASARADAVAGGLQSLGLQRESIERSASGDAPPMIDEGRNTGVAGTRRAEIWLDY
jgi:outer membrane protein OmpA-like peptidoglycan-associated protein